VRQIPGDFVLAAVGPRLHARQELLVSSVLSVVPYYYVPDAARPVHGPDVFSVARDAGLPWEWNVQALRCLAWLGHTVGEDSLHPRVRRIPACAVLQWREGRWMVHQEDFWAEIWRGPPLQPTNAVRVFNEVLRELIGETPILPLTGGFDSRALLAAVLAEHRRPILITMGRATATDRVVASAISRDLGLEHHFVELDATDYLRWAPEISRLTSGTKSAGNWHTYLYARRCRELGPGPVIVGSNGEFFRTYYLDAGFPAQVYGTAPPLAVFAYFAARLMRRQRLFPNTFSFLQGTGLAHVLELARWLTQLCREGPTALDALDLFYATQRVRHFIGNGHALYAANTRAVSPFLDSRMLRVGAGLPRRERLGSQFHRRLIRANTPRLAEYPIHGEPTMLAAPRPLYWMRRPREIGYGVFEDVLRLPAAREILHESPRLDLFLSRRDRQRLLSHRRPAAEELMLTLHYAASAAAAVGPTVV